VQKLPRRCKKKQDEPVRGVTYGKLSKMEEGSLHVSAIPISVGLRHFPSKAVPFGTFKPSFTAKPDEQPMDDPEDAAFVWELLTIEEAVRPIEPSSVRREFGRSREDP
jgi:hypothetical protein